MPDSQTLLLHHKILPWFFTAVNICNIKYSSYLVLYEFLDIIIL